MASKIVYLMELTLNPLSPHSWGVAGVKKGGRLDREESLDRRHRISRMVASGISIRMAAKRFGVSEMTVRRACQENGVHGGKWETPKYVEVLGELYRGGKTQAEIARYLEVTEALVSLAARWARSVGLPVNTTEDRPGTIRIIDAKLEGGIS